MIPNVWTRHWKLTRDPFLGGGTPYVPLAEHEEAVSRIVHVVDSHQPYASVRGAGGIGKSTVLAQALDLLRSPSRRILRISTPPDGPSLLLELADRLGARLPLSAGRAEAWRALREAARLCRWQSLQLVVAVDGSDGLVAPSSRDDLKRLSHLDPHPHARITVVETSGMDDDGSSGPAPWTLAIHVRALTRSDAEQLVRAKLAAAGRDEPTFTPRALNRLHAVASGVPRTLERLASLSLMAGALRGLEVVPPELIDGVALECEALA